MKRRHGIRAKISFEICEGLMAFFKSEQGISGRFHPMTPCFLPNLGILHSIHLGEMQIRTITVCEACVRRRRPAEIVLRRRSRKFSLPPTLNLKIWYQTVAN